MRRLALALLGAALLLSGCKFDGAYDLPLPGSPVSKDNSYEVTADFADILNVVPRSPVMVDDVTVGEVTDVERVGWHARLTMRVRQDVVLPDNPRAEIRQVSLLGEKYVALLEPPGGTGSGQLGEGDNIPLSSTGRNPEVEEVLGALSYLLSGGGVEQLSTITHELNNVMSGREDRLRHLLGSLRDTVSTLDSQKAQIISALESLDHLSATLNREKGTITRALDVVGPAVRVLDDQHAQLIGMLSSLDRLGVVGTRVIRGSRHDVLATLADLRPVLTKLNEAGEHLAPGLSLAISFPFPQEASEVVQGDYANTSIRADINLQNFVDATGANPDLPPLPDLPNPGLVLDCLESGNLTSRACQQVLSDADLLDNLKDKCQDPKYDHNQVCQVILQVPSIPTIPTLPTTPTIPGGGTGPSGHGGGVTPTVPSVPTIPTLPGLPGLGGARFVAGLTDGAAEVDSPMDAPSPWSLYGGEDR